MVAVRRALILPIFIIGTGLVACSSDLTEDRAAQTIRTHFDDIDARWVDSTMANVQIIVGDILQESQGRREVRFRFASVQDTSRRYSIHLVRSQNGWVVGSYSPNMVDLVAGMVMSGRYMSYADLIEPLNRIDAAASHWFLEEIRTGRGAPEYRVVPTKEELKALVPFDSLPDDVNWGVFPEDAPTVIWVRDDSDPQRICAKIYEEISYPAEEFIWLVGYKTGDQRCRGEAEPYGLMMFSDVKQRIIESNFIFMD